MRDAKLNATAAALLGFLLEGPMTGWDLVRHANDTIGDFWTITRSQVYRELTAMNGAGLISAQEAGPRDRLPYAITAEGKKAFRAWIRETPSDEQIRYPLLLTMAFAQHLPLPVLQEFVHVHRSAHEERLDAYKSAKREHWAEMTSSERVTLQFGLHYEEAVLLWFDELPQLLELDGR